MNFGSPVPVLAKSGSTSKVPKSAYGDLAQEGTTPFGGAYSQLNAGLLRRANLERLERKTMYPRVNYEMTEEDHKKLLDACKPTVCMMIGSYSPPTPEENANRAWAELGRKMGFDWNTVQPIVGKGTRFFSAVPTETEEAKTERLAQEASARKAKEIGELKADIAKKQERLKELGEP